jgi:hypothetical protein
VFTKPQLGLGPGVGAQVASLQSPVFRSGRLKCIRSSGFKQWTERKNSLILAALSDMVDIRRPKYDGWRILFRMRLVKARENEISNDGYCA